MLAVENQAAAAENPADKTGSDSGRKKRILQDNKGTYEDKSEAAYAGDTNMRDVDGIGRERVSRERIGHSDRWPPAELGSTKQEGACRTAEEDDHEERFEVPAVEQGDTDEPKENDRGQTGGNRQSSKHVNVDHGPAPFSYVDSV